MTLVSVCPLLPILPNVMMVVQPLIFSFQNLFEVPSLYVRWTSAGSSATRPLFERVMPPKPLGVPHMSQDPDPAALKNVHAMHAHSPLSGLAITASFFFAGDGAAGPALLEAA